jgi:hypothetical protein
MKRLLLLYIATLLLVNVSPIMVASAQDESACANQLGTCFDLTDEARDLCFRKSAKLPACHDTEQGRLAAKRSAFSASFSQSSDDLDWAADATIINRECVENFDNFWLGSLVNGSSPSRDALFNLSQILDGCARGSLDEMMRP